MVQKRFYQSANAISSVWYSAWVDPGSPALNSSEKINRESKSVFQGFQSKLQELLLALKNWNQQMRDKLQNLQEESLREILKN